MKKYILVGAGAVILLGIIVMLTQTFAAPTGAVQLTKAPNDMKVTVDGKEQKDDLFDLPVGKHKIKGERTDFVEKEITVDVKEGQKHSIMLLLEPLNAVGDQWLADHPEQSGLYSAQSSQNFDEDVEAMTEDNPIVQELPIIDREWRITYEQSEKYKDTPGAISLHIYATNPSARQNALGWMRQLGYDPSDMEIIFEQP